MFAYTGSKTDFHSVIFLPLLLLISLCCIFKMNMHCLGSCFSLQKITPKTISTTHDIFNCNHISLGHMNRCYHVKKKSEISEFMFPSSISTQKILFMKVLYKSNNYSYIVILQYITLIFLEDKIPRD